MEHDKVSYTLCTYIQLLFKCVTMSFYNILLLAKRLCITAAVLKRLQTEKIAFYMFTCLYLLNSCIDQVLALCTWRFDWIYSNKCCWIKLEAATTSIIDCRAGHPSPPICDFQHWSSTGPGAESSPLISPHPRQHTKPLHKCHYEVFGWHYCRGTNTTFLPPSNSWAHTSSRTSHWWWT